VGEEKISKSEGNNEDQEKLHREARLDTPYTPFSRAQPFGLKSHETVAECLSMHKDRLEWLQCLKNLLQQL